MNIPGPSRVAPPGRLAPRGRVESAYEEDLLRLVNQLSVDDMSAIQNLFTERTRAGGSLSDREVAMSDFIGQARTLAVVDQDRALAQRIAAGEDVVDHMPPPRFGAVPRPNANG